MFYIYVLCAFIYEYLECNAYIIRVPSYFIRTSIRYFYGPIFRHMHASNSFANKNPKELSKEIVGFFPRRNDIMLTLKGEEEFFL